MTHLCIPPCGHSQGYYITVYSGHHNLGVRPGNMPYHQSAPGGNQAPSMRRSTSTRGIVTRPTALHH